MSLRRAKERSYFQRAFLLHLRRFRRFRQLRDGSIYTKLRNRPSRGRVAKSRDATTKGQIDTSSVSSADREHSPRKYAQYVTRREIENRFKTRSSSPCFPPITRTATQSVRADKARIKSTIANWTAASLARAARESGRRSFHADAVPREGKARRKIRSYAAPKQQQHFLPVSSLSLWTLAIASSDGNGVNCAGNVTES